MEVGNKVSKPLTQKVHKNSYLPALKKCVYVCVYVFVYVFACECLCRPVCGRYTEVLDLFPMLLVWEWPDKVFDKGVIMALVATVT